MPRALAIGDEAPNFDLSSTEDAVLSLRDEVGRNSVVLYFFSELDSDRTRRDLIALQGHLGALSRLRTKVLAVATAGMDDLKKLQADLGLRFPLLRDDRRFSQAYGVVSSEEGKPAPPALAVVSRRQEIRWLANPVASVEQAIGQVEQHLKPLPSPTSAYPKVVVNRLVDWWTNSFRRLPRSPGL